MYPLLEVLVDAVNAAMAQPGAPTWTELARLSGSSQPKLSLAFSMKKRGHIEYDVIRKIARALKIDLWRYSPDLSEGQMRALEAIDKVAKAGGDVESFIEKIERAGEWETREQRPDPLGVPRPSTAPRPAAPRARKSDRPSR